MRPPPRPWGSTCSVVRGVGAVAPQYTQRPTGSNRRGIRFDAVGLQCTLNLPPVGDGDDRRRDGLTEEDSPQDRVHPSRRWNPQIAQLELATLAARRQERDAIVGGQERGAVVSRQIFGPALDLHLYGPPPATAARGGARA